MSNNQMIDSCLLVNRRVEQRQEHSVTRTEITHRRVLQESPQDIAQFTTTAPEHSQSQSIQQSSSYSVDIAYLGHSHSHAHNGHLASAATGADPPLPSDATQQVTTVTKVVREVHQMGPDGGQGGGGLAPHPHPLPQHYQHQHPHQHPHQPVDPHQMPAEQQHGRLYGDQYRPTYQDYDHYPYPDQVYPGAFPTYGERPGTPPSPSEPSDSPTATATAIAHHDFLRKGAPFPTASYDDMEPAHYRITPSPGGLADRYDQMSNPWPIEDTGEPSQLSHGMRWRDPNLTEVISFLSNPNDVIKANAAAYLQHLCYMDDPNKQKTRSLGGIPPLVRLLAHDAPDVYRNACGALRNLSYGRQNDENKRAIKNAGGIPLLMNLLKKPSDAEVKELVTGVLWNLSSCEDLKRAIIDDGLLAIVGLVIVPHSGWDPAAPGDTCWSTVFRNTTGVLRNVSSAGEYARKRLRECPGLVDALLYVVRAAIDKANIGNKSVENCVCVLRNLSYRCQEVDDPDYDKQPPPGSGRAAATRPTPPKGENSGCFGASKKKKDATAAAAAAAQQKEGVAGGARGPRGRTGGVGGGPPAGVELLWQPEVVQAYLSLLQTCSNPETLEAAAGALQNLAACYWQPSAEMRAAVRKEKGLPILVELLRMEVDRVVCAVATALRNLAIDQRNKELIGKYAMRDLVQKLPTGNPQHDQGTSDDTIAAVLATLNEVIKKNAEFSRSLLESGGVERLMNITKQRQKYTARVLKFAGQVLFTMWQHQELREVYKKHGWKEQDFVSKTAAAAAARDAGAPHSPDNANNTLNRPMASQGGTRYEDRTVQRPRPPHPHTDNDEIPLADMSYPEGSSHAPGPRTVKPGEPLYAQVNREKKKNRGGAAAAAGGGLQDGAGGGAPGPADLWGYDEAKALVVDGGGGPPPGGDSWV